MLIFYWDTSAPWNVRTKRGDSEVSEDAGRFGGLGEIVGLRDFGGIGGGRWRRGGHCAVFCVVFGNI